MRITPYVHHTRPSPLSHQASALSPRRQGFALTEMRVLLPRLLSRFRVEIPTGSSLFSVRCSHNDATYAAWAREIAGPVQPHELRLRVVALRHPRSGSRL